MSQDAGFVRLDDYDVAVHTTMLHLHLDLLAFMSLTWHDDASAIFIASCF